MPPWLFAALFVGLCGLVLIVLSMLPLSKLADYLGTHVFAGLPHALRPAPDNAYAGFAPSFVVATLVGRIVIDGIANPIVEELYFRGYLLPRLTQFGWLAPLVHTALFTLAHFWQPYNYVTIFVTVLPLTYVTWWRRNIYLQMALHCFANTVGACLALYCFLHMR
jgi:membrane protease YdiL (CAAX protease family)